MRCPGCKTRIPSPIPRALEGLTSALQYRPDRPEHSSEWYANRCGYIGSAIAHAIARLQGYCGGCVPKRVEELFASQGVR